MYMNTGYLNNSLLDFKDNSRPLVVGSCGTYRLFTQSKLPTYRPKGRVDFQLLYIASGKGYFYINGRKETVTAGHMVLYQPKEVQKYVYYGTDETEVYWVHFTGSDVKNILRKYNFLSQGAIFYTGNSVEYHRLFLKMILELQLCKPHFEELLSMYLQELFALISRQFNENQKLSLLNQAEMEDATKYFTEHYSSPINIDDYAGSRHMSTCWFIRSFKQYNGITPMQYILSMRISNAQHLLATTDYNITEIAAFVGYDNPLYFSRLFKKQTGISPSEYRKFL